MLKDKKFIQQGFNQIATKYNFFNNLVTLGAHLRFKKKLCKRVLQSIEKTKKNITIVDICCGTGDITYCLAKLAPKNYKIIGMDFSDKMLAIAKQKQTNKTNLKFILTDVLPLPLEDASISAITVGYGLRNLVDLDFALQEISRVLQKGGIFGCLDMGKVTLPIAKQIFNFAFFKLIPKIGELLVANSKMFTYFPDSTKNYPSPQKLVTKLKENNFKSVSYHKNLFGACVTHLAIKS